MKVAAAALLLLLAVAVAFCQGDDFLEAVKLLERISSEGIDVTPYVEQLNRALELYRANRTSEADALVARVLYLLRELESRLPIFRFQKWLQVGTTVALLLAIPPLFYYFFPRVYALVWAYSRKDWVVKEVSKRGSRR